jgi:hypothetical protein
MKPPAYLKVLLGWTDWRATESVTGTLEFMLAEIVLLFASTETATLIVRPLIIVAEIVIVALSISRVC